MAKNKDQKLDNRFETIEETLSKTEQFLEKYQKQLTIVAGAILLVVALVFLYKKYIVIPQTEEAQEQIFVAQQYFERDSFNLALNGDGDFPGFLSIIDEYGSTNVADLAHYYAGISYLKLGEYEKAIDYLSDFSTSDAMLSAVKEGAIGDAYTELGKFDKAVGYYKKAADRSDNKLTAPIYLMKLGRASEELKDWKGALSAYQKIKDEYKDTQEGRSIEKFITRVKLKM
ncbi:MAG: tetratricopeptide repeat protein [Chlorobi bacterium]|nr:tetratricopeptide repeat protein [Chlorobiota bacterium]